MKRRINIPGITDVKPPKPDGTLTLVQIPAQEARKPGIIGDGSMRSPYRFEGQLLNPPNPAARPLEIDRERDITPTLLQRGLDALRGRSQISGILDETNFGPDGQPRNQLLLRREDIRSDRPISPRPFTMEEFRNHLPEPEDAANDQPPAPATWEEPEIPLNGQIALALGWQSVWPCTRGTGRWFMESPNPAVAGENMVQVVPDYIEMLRQYMARDGARLVNDLVPRPRQSRVLAPMSNEEAQWADNQGYLEIGQTHATVTRRYGFRQYVREVGERYRVIPPPPPPTTTRI